MDPPWNAGKKCSNVPGRMTKIASMHIYIIKPFKISSFGIKRLMTLKLGIQLRVLKYCKICSNNDTGLTLTIFMIWSNLFPNASAWVKAYAPCSYLFQACSNSAYNMHSGEQCRTNGPLVPVAMSQAMLITTCFRENRDR